MIASVVIEELSMLADDEENPRAARQALRQAVRAYESGRAIDSMLFPLLRAARDLQRGAGSVEMVVRLSRVASRELHPALIVKGGSP